MIKISLCKKNHITISLVNASLKADKNHLERMINDNKEDPLVKIK